MKLNINKKKLALTVGLLLTLGVSYGYIYNKLHTNTPDDVRDHTGKYVLNPDYKDFHKYQWTDLKSIYPTKLAYDPQWFKLPSDKYIPKEQPIPKEIKNISDLLIRRQAYFNFLCETEDVSYIINQYNSKFIVGSVNLPSEDGILYLNNFINIPKIKNYSNDLNNQFIYIENADKNPFILSIYKDYYYPLIDGHTYNFFGVDLDINPDSLKSPFYNSNNNQFVEMMNDTGQLFRIEYDVKSKKFLPSKKINESNAKYYTLTKFIERESLKNLGIYGSETIMYNKKNNILVSYSKHFYIGKFSYDENKFSWSKLDSCNKNKNIIDNF